MRGYNIQEAISVLLAWLLGVTIIVSNAGLPMGSLQRLGPGAVPTAMGVIICVLATFVGIQNIRSDAPLELVPLRVVFVVAMGMASWALLIQDYGFMPATLSLVLISTMIKDRLSWAAILIMCLALTTIGYLIFVVGLRLSIPLIDW